MRIEAKLPNGADHLADLKSVLATLAGTYSGLTGDASVDGDGIDTWIEANDGQQLVAAIEALGPVFTAIGTKPTSMRMSEDIPDPLRQRLGSLSPRVTMLAR